MVSPLSRRVLELALGERAPGAPRSVSVAQWGTPLDEARHVLFYFGGMPASVSEPPLHSLKSAGDLYESRGVHLVLLDKPGMGATPLSTSFQIRRDWPAMVAGVADALGVESYGVFGVSNGGPYVMSCLTAEDDEIRKRVRAGCMIVGQSDVSASGYFSARHPGGLFEGVFNSLPLALTGPLIWAGLASASFFLFGPPNLYSRMTDPPQLQSPGARAAAQAVLRDARASWGWGAALDCQQGLSPLHARPAEGAQSAAEAFARVDVPVGLFYGERDATVPMFTAEYLHALLPKSTLRFLDAGHSLYLFHAETVLDDLLGKMEEPR